MDEKDGINKPVKMSLLTKIIGAVILVGVTFTTCYAQSSGEL